MDIAADLLTEIEAFLKARNLSETRFGLDAVNDGHLVKRIRNSGNVTLLTVRRVRKYMADEMASSGEAA